VDGMILFPAPVSSYSEIESTLQMAFVLLAEIRRGLCYKRPVLFTVNTFIEQL
jgi:hypothetical protein